jgi:membrane-associated protease RseP (regulator of RpoE activity)
MYATKRSGFAMILAIFIVVLISLGGVMLLNGVSIGVKSVGDAYFQAQAQLLAESATEFAVMRVQDVNTSVAAPNNHCLEKLNITIQDATGAPAYDANITIRYSFFGAAPVACLTPLADVNTTMAQNTGNPTMMLIDTTVTDHNLSTESIRVVKRSWQKL